MSTTMQYNNQNYRSFNAKQSAEARNESKGKEKTRLVIDETTIYEIDTECENCKRKYDYLHNTDKFQ